MTSWAIPSRPVEARARGRCEDRRMHQALQGATFHVEHIIPGSRGGASNLDNLAGGCPTCNLHKSDRIVAPDPETNGLVPLFNPRRNARSEHFGGKATARSGKRPSGRATVLMLDLNHPRRILIRRAEALSIVPPLIFDDAAAKINRDCDSVNGRVRQVLR